MGSGGPEGALKWVSGGDCAGAYPVWLEVCALAVDGGCENFD